MRHRIAIIVIALSAAIGIRTASAQDYSQPVEYLDGHAGLGRQTVWLFATESALLVKNEKRTKTLLEIPLASVTKIEASTEDKGPGWVRRSCGDKWRDTATQN